MRWTLFGIVIVAAPPLLSCWYKTIVGRIVDYYEVLPDVLLVLLSICCNSINICIDGDKKIFYFLRWVFGIILGLISIGSYGLYFIIFFSKEILIKFNLDKLININSINIIDEITAKKLFDISTIIILICAFIGSIIEFCTAASNKSFVKKGK